MELREYNHEILLFPSTGQMSLCRRFRRLIVTAIDTTVNGPAFFESWVIKRTASRLQPIGMRRASSCLKELVASSQLCSHNSSQEGRFLKGKVPSMRSFSRTCVNMSVTQIKKGMVKLMTVKPMKRAMQTLVFTVIALGVSSGVAQNVEQIKVVSEHVIPNTEGKSMVVVVVTYPQGAKSPPHHHAASAFIYAHVLSGAIRSQVDNEPPKDIPGRRRLL